jgi:hypothetical protein
LKRITADQFSKYESSAKKGGLLFLAAVMMSLIALFTLVLVLLAIERNTRSSAHLLARAVGATPANSDTDSDSAA